MAAFSDLLKEYQVSDEDVCKSVSDAHLEEISLAHCKKWRSLPSHLGLDNTIEDDINSKTEDESEKRHDFLTEWKQRKGSEATYKALINALLKIDCRSDAEYVCQLLQLQPPLPKKKNQPSQMSQPSSQVCQPSSPLSQPSPQKSQPSPQMSQPPSQISQPSSQTSQSSSQMSQPTSPLAEISKLYLEPLSKDEVVFLGLVLGLEFDKLNECPDAQVLSNMVHDWLSRKNRVMDKSGAPSSESLCIALEARGHNDIAANIRKDYPIVVYGPPSQKVKAHHYDLLMKQLVPCQAEWEGFASKLDFLPDEIERIKEDPEIMTGGPEACLGGVLREWMTWEEGDAEDVGMLKALKKAADKAGFPQVADSLTVDV